MDTVTESEMAIAMAVSKIQLWYKKLILQYTHTYVHKLCNVCVCVFMYIKYRTVIYTTNKFLIL